MEIGTSLFDQAGADIVEEIMAMAKDKGVEIVLPTDFVISNKFGEDGEIKTATVRPQATLLLAPSPSAGCATGNHGGACRCARRLAPPTHVVRTRSSTAVHPVPSGKPPFILA